MFLCLAHAAAAPSPGKVEGKVIAAQSTAPPCVNLQPGVEYHAGYQIDYTFVEGKGLQLGGSMGWVWAELPLTVAGRPTERDVAKSPFFMLRAKTARATQVYLELKNQAGQYLVGVPVHSVRKVLLEIPSTSGQEQWLAFDLSKQKLVAADYQALVIAFSDPEGAILITAFGFCAQMP